VSGSFFTRIGIGGVPFLLPLLYQIGLGFTPIQSGLLIMPQAVGALGVKTVMRTVLRVFGYRGVLIYNTVIIGVLLLAFAQIGAHTPVWIIVLLAFAYGWFTSLQYTSMNTLVDADTAKEQASSVSSIASTMQQMSVSFGVAGAGLTTSFFISNAHAPNQAEAIHGIHGAFLVLGALTIVSTLVFDSLHVDDGNDVSQQKVVHHGG
jgi:hypothetical protein